jgi:hypothetical protein
MTLVKKLGPDWHPQEHPGIIVGDIVDFPGNTERLVAEGSVTLVDADGNELSAYDSLGIVTNRELEEFRSYKEQLKQEAFKKTLEAEREELIAAAEAIKQEKAQVEPEEKKKEIAKKK